MSVPVGVGAAVYLEEFADKNTWYNRLIEINIQNLAGVPAIVYGILGIGLTIRDGDVLEWVYRTYNDWVLDFAKRADAHRIFPLACLPCDDPRATVREIRRCAKRGMRGGDILSKRMVLPIWHRDWFPVWQAAAECRFLISFHSVGFNGIRAPADAHMREQFRDPYACVQVVMFQIDSAEVLVSIIASGGLRSGRFRASKLRLLGWMAGPMYSANSSTAEISFRSRQKYE